jgi:hypothetical protein
MHVKVLIWTSSIFFILEVALNKSDDLNIYAYENVSHIPTAKLIEIFEINTGKDPFIIDGYRLTKTMYKEHKIYLQEQVGVMNLDIFEYTLRQYASSDIKEVRKFYKESMME